MRWLTLLDVQMTLARWCYLWTPAPCTVHSPCSVFFHLSNIWRHLPIGSYIVSSGLLEISVQHAFFRFFGLPVIHLCFSFSLPQLSPPTCCLSHPLPIPLSVSLLLSYLPLTFWLSVSLHTDRTLSVSVCRRRSCIILLGLLVYSVWTICVFLRGPSLYGAKDQ